jgi:hypothetical protein
VREEQPGAVAFRFQGERHRGVERARVFGRGPPGQAQHLLRLELQDFAVPVAAEARRGLGNALEGEFVAGLELEVVRHQPLGRRPSGDRPAEAGDILRKTAAINRSVDAADHPPRRQVWPAGRCGARAAAATLEA